MTAPLSPYEEIKRNLNPYTSLRPVVARLALEGAAAITESDEIVLRWHGLYRQLPLETGTFMLRLKLPEGAISAKQALLAADLAESVGEGNVCLTTRQGIELHEVHLADLPATFLRLDAEGLTTVGACGDQVRNVVGCPVADIDPRAESGTSALAQELVAAFIGKIEFANLPRKFKISLSDCSCGCVPYDVNDVGLVAARNSAGQPGYALVVGGGLSTQPAYAVNLGIWVNSEEVVEVVSHIVSIFRDYGNREKRNRARLKYLIAARGIDWLRDELQSRLQKPLTPYDQQVPTPARRDHLGIHAQREAGLVYLGVLVPLGIMSSVQLRTVGEIAQEFGQGRLRLTHMQNIIISDIAEAQVSIVLERLSAVGLPVAAENSNERVAVCVGKTYCAKAIVHTRENLRPLMENSSDPLLGSAVSLRVSGCPNGCAGHVMADIGLHGVTVKTEAGSEERFDIFVGGGEAAGTAAFGQRVLKKQRPDELAATISGLLQRFRVEAVSGETFSDFARRVLWTTARLG